MTQPSDQHWLHQASSWLEDNQSPQAPGTLSAAIQKAEEAELEVLVDMILQKDLQDKDVAARARKLLQYLASRLVSLGRPIIPAQTLEELYRQIASIDVTAGGHTLQCLAAQADQASLTALADLLANQPPDSWQTVALAVSPLWRIDQAGLSLFFDSLEGSTIQPSTLTVLLDLANHSVRTGKVQQHPWLDRNADMSKLLSQVVVHLEKLQSDPRQYGSTVDAVQKVLGDSVALTVSLCDTLGLIGLPENAKALEEAMGLAHRRIQAEAAAALARMGQENGIARLVSLAADPVCRSRVVQYAEELDLSGAIAEQYRFPQALAESELACWLASPEQYGFPPSIMEHLETRTLYWPGYDEPRDCYLFRFTYQIPQGSFSNIGVAGPVTKAFACDISELSRDDQYALFAGWQVEHDEIYEVPRAEFNSSQRAEAERLASLMSMSGYSVDSMIALTFMLGESALLAKLGKDNQTYFGITDGESSVNLPSSQSPTSYTPDIVLAIYRGRKLLKAFN